jgi:serine/threonine protein kinase
MVPRIGTEFAGYRIVALLGRGGMSIVYRAENPRLGTTVALKVLAPELVEDESFRERFVTESRLAAALNHPNIITIYDAGEADGSLYIAMRYVSGDLKQVFDTEGALPPGRLVALLGQTADALDAAHAKELIHRDVKPANILLDGGGPERPELAYLADFGLTKHAGSISGMTVAGSFVGTIDYVAPEQIDDGSLDGRADLYSLGCVAYEGLTGSPPFRRDTQPAVLWAHMQDEPPRASEHRADLPAATDDVVVRALAKDPDERYDSCGEFVSSLADSLGLASPTPTAAARPAAPKPRKKKREGQGSNRRRLLIPLGLLALVAAGVAAGVGAALATDSESAPELRTITEVETIVEPPEDLTEFDVALGNLIPAGIRDTCDPVEPISDAFDSTMSCRGGVEGIPSVEYSHARGGHGLNDYLRSRAALAGIEFDPDATLGTTATTCGDPEASLRDYRAHGQTGHELTDEPTLSAEGMGEYQIDRTILGRVLCYRNENGRFWMEWTDGRSGVYTTASGRAKNLIPWWESSAGPMD